MNKTVIYTITLLSIIATLYFGKSYLQEHKKTDDLFHIPAHVEKEPVFTYNSDSSDVAINVRLGYYIPGHTGIHFAHKTLDSNYKKIFKGYNIMVLFDPTENTILLEKEHQRNIRTNRIYFLASASVLIFSIFFIRRKNKKRR